LTIDETTLPRQGENALGVPGAQQYVNDLPNDANKKFVAASNHRGAAQSWTQAMSSRLARRTTTMARQLSGSEQQILAIARPLMTNPQLLVLGESTDGLAPLIRADIWRCLTALKRTCQSIDKNVDALIEIADHHYVIERGHITWSGPSRERVAAADVRRQYLGFRQHDFS
jgi:branched-chain amino acid transport system ATP-binding protein